MAAERRCSQLIFNDREPMDAFVREQAVSGCVWADRQQRTLSRILLDEAISSPAAFLRLLGESRYRPKLREERAATDRLPESR